MSSRAKDSKRNGDKGSYRHMRALVKASKFRGVMNTLLKKTGACLATEDHRVPTGGMELKDWKEVQLEGYLKLHPLGTYKGLCRKWWIPFRGNRPTWDLICHAEIDGKPGLLLVEAKAHFTEMAEKNETKATDVANRLSIQLRLAEASLGLRDLNCGRFCLSADHDYQLSNRLAYLHKLASEGVPVILLYLGWLNSDDWSKDHPFVDESAWSKAVKEHFERIGPWDFVGKKYALKSGASLQMIVRGIRPDDLGPPEKCS